LIAIIDYGAGNLRSVVNAFEFIGQKPRIVNTSNELKQASAIVLPGVGSFGEGVAHLRSLALIESLNQEVLVKKKPYLGICLGLQFLASESSEHGRHEGLGWIPGSVERLKAAPGIRIPHMGWNNVRPVGVSRLLQGFADDPVFYFVHSYAFVPPPDHQDVVVGTAWHGQDIAAVVEKENIVAVQFHPEKSQADGLRLLENFVKMI
jgi:glutamine amidotransferase